MIFNPTEENIQRAAEQIKHGNIVAFPTETVYGLGADCFNPIAVAKIFEAKQRPAFNPLIVHINSLTQLENIAEIHNDRILKLINSFWPGPLTVILPRKKSIPDIVTSGLDTVAIRMPRHKVALSLIHKAGVPIAAPSANMFGLLSPTTSAHVQNQLSGRVEFILDGGNAEIGLESTIVDFSGGSLKILRPGGLTIEEIEKVAGKAEVEKNINGKPNSPGQLQHHYAPSKPLFIIDDNAGEIIKGKKAGAIFLSGNNTGIKFHAEKILSPEGDLREAAANFFRHLHELENSNVEIIAAEKIEERGLGIAIMDRLNRAAAKFASG